MVVRRVALLVSAGLATAIVGGLLLLIASERRSGIGQEAAGVAAMVVGATEQRPESLCRACFDGSYPVPVPQQLEMDKMQFEMPPKSDHVPGPPSLQLVEPKI